MDDYTQLEIQGEQFEHSGVLSLTLTAEGIQEIYALLNPEKLVYLQQQLVGRGATSEAPLPATLSPDQS